MSDMYQEILVKRNTPFSDQIKKYLLIVVTVISVMGGLVINPILLLPAVVFGFLCYFMVPRFDLEYEYLYVSGELDIDKIMGKQKRKRCASYNMDNLEILAPSNSAELNRFKNKKDVKVRDFTSLKPDTPSYTLVFNLDRGQELVKVELNEAVIGDIRRMAPRKILKY